MEKKDLQEKDLQAEDGLDKIELLIYSDIDSWEFKESLNYKEYNAIIDTAINLTSGKIKEDARFKDITKKIAITLYVCDFFEQNGKKIELNRFSSLSLDDLFKLVYKVDYKHNINDASTLRSQVEDVENAIDYIWEEENVSKSLASKYDNILSNIIDLLETIKEQYKDVDIKEFSHDLETISDKVGKVDEDNLIQVILRNLKKKDVN